jgi:NADPH:quinone reductase-like Zn-dependent oxidoreductase
MRAIVQDVYGTVPEDILRLAEVDRPTIGDDEVLVRVQAASVDRGTWHIMTGLPYPWLCHISTKQAHDRGRRVV